MQPAQAGVTGEREVHYRHLGLKSARALAQRGLVGNHHHRSEAGFEQAAHSFREAVMSIRKQHTVDSLLGHRVPPAPRYRGRYPTARGSERRVANPSGAWPSANYGTWPWETTRFGRHEPEVDRRCSAASATFSL